MNLGNRLQKLREDQKLSQEELAEEINVSRQAISKWENGNSKPDINNIIRLSEVFGVSTDYLLKGDTEEVEEETEEIKRVEEVKFNNKREISTHIKILIVIGGISLIAILFIITLTLLVKIIFRRTL